MDLPPSIIKQLQPIKPHIVGISPRVQQLQLVNNYTRVKEGTHCTHTHIISLHLIERSKETANTRVAHKSRQATPGRPVLPPKIVCAKKHEDPASPGSVIFLTH